MKLLRYRPLFPSNLLGDTAAKRHVRRPLGISQIQASTKPSRVEQRMLQKNVRVRRSWATREELRIAIVTRIKRTYYRRRRQIALDCSTRSNPRPS